MIARHGMFLLSNGFSGYNQVRVALVDQPEMCLITKWGVYATRMMSFGLMNAPSTFQRELMTTFAEFETTL